ncbi:hypothetical protein CCH79_00020049 [Gambusia affinis]|uniref:Inactive dual specificity phosphatase 27 n=1 Tax=Gambusia affinis TaxID=33528 RepID=A0A315UWI2_GAMAF|nr:hypothetical protein CCH79_00020049 [Gambusia affinis]
METANESEERSDQAVHDEEEEEEVRGVQARYLRCPSPSFSMTSLTSRFSDASSIVMEPIHLSSAVAAKKIISEELPPRAARPESVPESMLESAEQLMVEDLYNRVRDMLDDRSPYNTPCVLDIQRAMVQDRLEAPANPVDEVWPNILIGEKSVAVNKARLKRMGITHILNTAHGTGVYTGQAFYANMDIQYRGIELDDFPDADIAAHFRPAAEFLDEALLTHKGRNISEAVFLFLQLNHSLFSKAQTHSQSVCFAGKVLVVSMMGVSRSAILVASYLMIFQNMTIMEALTTIRKKRAINPNEGFLKQLREFNETLMEERDDDDETLSQCSVIDARARIFGEERGDDDEETDGEEERSVVKVKAQSIMMEEEEDRESIDLPGQTATEDGAEDDDDGLDSMIREWQRRNEKYQSEEWWEAQLHGEEESISAGHPKAARQEDDRESVTSEDVRAVKERLRHRNKRPSSNTMSTSSCTSYSDLWKQRLKEIEEQAAARYRKTEDHEGTESTRTEGGNTNIDAEVESILSDTSSMYNFCQKNKEKMTPLERWRIKRIQFGWNKKDREDGEKSSATDGEEESKTPSFQDVNLTAYQAWKLRQQKRLGEENTEEILELSRGDDSATIKRRQRREVILERSKKTLEESQSMCGWDSESCVSGGTIPLSAFWAGAGVTGPPSVANDDNMSMLSGRSTQSASQALPPVLPVPAVPGPAGEPMVNLASIQNWIANVVTETIKQKQSELSLPPSSCAGSELSFGAAPNMVAGRGAEDDRVSWASYSSTLSKAHGRATSVLSGGSSMSGLSGQRSALGSKKTKITTTSVPLFSLFQDQVNLGKLDAIEKEIRSEMREKGETYEKKKILEDNKRSTLYKKKKLKEDEDEEQDRMRKEEEFLEETKKKEKPKRSYGLSGCLNLNPVIEKDQNTSIDDWLRSVRPPPGKLTSAAEADPSQDPYDDLDASASQFDFSDHRGPFAAEEDDEEAFGVTSRYRPRFGKEAECSCNGFTQSHRRAGRSSEDGTDGVSLHRRFAHRSRYDGSEAAGRRDASSEEEEEDEDEDVEAFIAQTRRRIRARAAAEAEDDEVLCAWREQQGAKARRRVLGCEE